MGENSCAFLGTEARAAGTATKRSLRTARLLVVDTTKLPAQTRTVTISIKVG